MWLFPQVGSCYEPWIQVGSYGPQIQVGSYGPRIQVGSCYGPWRLRGSCFHLRRILVLGYGPCLDRQDLQIVLGSERGCWIYDLADLARSGVFIPRLPPLSLTLTQRALSLSLSHALCAACRRRGRCSPALTLPLWGRGVMERSPRQGSS